MASKAILYQSPTLYKHLDKGKIGVWSVHVEDPADIVTTYGMQGGKLQTTRDRITKGKNEGKANATTPAEQAIKEAKALYEKHLKRKQYVTDIDEAQAVREEACMLAHDFSKHAAKVRWDTAFAQPKLDGYRCVMRWDSVNKRVVMRSREGLAFETLRHISEPARQFFTSHPDIAIDGEVYAHGMPFQSVSSAVKRKSELTERLELWAYDCIVPGESFGSRYGVLKSLLERFSHPFVRLVKTVKVRSQVELSSFAAEVLQEGYEGAMLRHGADPYAAGKRSSSLLKVKQFDETDFEIVDARTGRGKDSESAVFVCVTKENEEFEVLAPGTRERKQELWQKHSECIGKFIAVKHQGWTEAKLPRAPVALDKFRNRPGVG